jgi:hypothetical protein
MLAKLATCTLVGIDPTPVEVEVDGFCAQMHETALVGLAQTAVNESTHRIERAIKNSGYKRVIDRVLINLAPDYVLAARSNSINRCGRFCFPSATSTRLRARAWILALVVSAIVILSSQWAGFTGRAQSLWRGRSCLRSTASLRRQTWIYLT